jgi:hypothetical protein
MPVLIWPDLDLSVSQVAHIPSHCVLKVFSIFALQTVLGRKWRQTALAPI